MRFLRHAILGAIALVLVVVALANRQTVTLRLLPDDLAALAGVGPAIEAPLYAVILAGIVAGVLIGFVWEWLREHKYRASAVQNARRAAGLERTLARSGHRPAPRGPADEIAALVDGPSAPTGQGAAGRGV